MPDITWGLLGPETLGRERRTRTLSLGSTVRAFNDLAVPGLGGVWLGKQLLLSALGVQIAERLRSQGKRTQNIVVADAIEALACWLALDSSGWKRDPRIRGALKLSGRTDLSFATVSRRTFYVTQPMRQFTVQPLHALGMVESNGERFNSFRCTSDGESLIDAAWNDFRPYNRPVSDHLTAWAKGSHSDVKTSSELTEALSPLEPMSASASEFLRERIVQGSRPESVRRRNALAWVETLTNVTGQIDWREKPSMVDERHWLDLYAGSLFFAARDSAIHLLDEIESYIGNTAERRLSLDAALPEVVAGKAAVLREHAKTFLDQNHDPSPAGEAKRFCRECTESEDARLVENLLFREGHVLRQRGRDILPGVAFRGKPTETIESARSAEEDGAETEVGRLVALPAGISHRVRNLFLLNLDLRGVLGEWLTEPVQSADATE